MIPVDTTSGRDMWVMGISCKIPAKPRKSPGNRRRVGKIATVPEEAQSLKSPLFMVDTMLIEASPHRLASAVYRPLRKCLKRWRFAALSWREAGRIGAVLWLGPPRGISDRRCARSAGP